MDDQAIWERLNPIFREILEDPDIELSPTTTADDIEGWDSITNIELLVAIEQEFDLKFHTGEIAGLANVGELVDLIAKRSAGS
jgi:acyl carrier protein